MSYIRATPIMPLAVSVLRAAAMLDVRRQVIDEAVKLGHLRVYQHGNARRILIEDIVEWIKNEWRGTRARPVPPKMENEHAAPR